MSFSYSGIVNYGKVTLPSVESWGTNNNILRDPPRSITTRRIDKVSETNQTLEDADTAHDRIAESIRVYPRGQNVMVGVSYNNQGGNTGGQQAKLPYRVMKDGVFRPPILTPVNLRPLSRLPRNATTIDPVANQADFKKKLMCPGTAKDYRSVKDATLQVQATVPKGQPIRVPLEVGVHQNIVSSVLHTEAQAGKTQKIAQPVEIGARQNIQDTVNAEAFTNIRYFAKEQQNHTVKYTKDAVKQLALHYDATAKPSRNINLRTVESHNNYHVNPRVNAEAISNPTRNINLRTVESQNNYHVNPRVQTSANTNVKAQTTKQVHHERHERREKAMLRGQMNANVSQVGRANPNAMPPTSSTIHLPQRASRGSQMSNPLVPSFERTGGAALPRLRQHSFHNLMRSQSQV